MTKKELDHLEYLCTGACIEVHRYLGPGLLESVYQKCLIQELELLGLSLETEKQIHIDYKGLELNTELRIDILVENSIVLELKAINEILPIHRAQTITYINLLEVPKGLLINFNCSNIVAEGKQSFVNKYFSHLVTEATSL